MKILISGATGFLGIHLVKYFLSKGDEVIGLGRNEIKGNYLKSLNCHFLKVSLENLTELECTKLVEQITSVDIVVHSAALSSPWGTKEEFYNSNVLGTKNIINLAMKLNVKKFIHISTPSLYFKFKDDFNITENTKLFSPFASNYTQSKYEAEKIVDEANLRNGLFTVTLRPRGIFGPGDESLLPRIIKIAGESTLPIIGNGKNIIDLTYVENVVLAVVKCIEGKDQINGQKYNITNGEPIELWNFLNKIFSELNIKNSKFKIPYKLAYIYAFLLEIVYRKFKINKEPKLTRYTVGLLAKSQTLSIEKAKVELKYIPKVNMDEAFINVIKDLKK